MKIIIEDGLSIVDETGPGQYTLTLAKALCELGYDVEVKRKYFLEKIKKTNLRRTLYLIWLNTIFLLRLLFLTKGTIVVYTNYSIPFIKIKKIIQIPVIHDLCSYLFPNTMTNIQNFYSVMATNNAIKNGDKIITVSNTVKQEIIKQFAIDENKIFVVYSSNTLTLINSNSSEDNQGIFSKYKIEPKKYILSVSTFNRRKNVLSLIEAFREVVKANPGIKLVLVGRHGNDEKTKVIKQDNPNIVFTDFVSQETLADLYKSALVYVFPSLYEGFGTPLVDAQYFNIPVLCSDIPIFHEIGQESVYFADTKNPSSLASSILEFIANNNRLNKLKEKGYENQKRFSLNVIKDQAQKVAEQKV